MMKFLFLILLLCIFNLNFAESKECQCKTPPNSVEDLLEQANYVVLFNVTSKNPLIVTVTSILKGDITIGVYNLTIPNQQSCDPRNFLLDQQSYVAELYKNSGHFTFNLCNYFKLYSNLSNSEKNLVNNGINKVKTGEEIAPTCTPFNLTQLLTENLGNCNTILGYGVIRSTCSAIIGCNENKNKLKRLLYSSTFKCVEACASSMRPNCQPLPKFNYGCTDIVGYAVNSSLQCSPVYACSRSSVPYGLFPNMVSCSNCIDVNGNSGESCNLTCPPCSVCAKNDLGIKTCVTKNCDGLAFEDCKKNSCCYPSFGLNCTGTKVYDGCLPTSTCTYNKTLCAEDSNGTRAIFSTACLSSGWGLIEGEGTCCAGLTSCQNIKCGNDEKCVISSGNPACVCKNMKCAVGSTCIEAIPKPKCLSVKEKSCDDIICSPGFECQLDFVQGLFPQPVCTPLQLPPTCDSITCSGANTSCINVTPMCGEESCNIDRGRCVSTFDKSFETSPCPLGMSGLDCDRVVCNFINGTYSCENPNMICVTSLPDGILPYCSCIPNRVGALCEEIVEDNCLCGKNRVCTNEKICICAPEWKGDNCDVPRSDAEMKKKVVYLLLKAIEDTNSTVVLTTDTIRESVSISHRVDQANIEVTEMIIPQPNYRQFEVVVIDMEESPILPSTVVQEVVTDGGVTINNSFGDGDWFISSVALTTESLNYGEDNNVSGTLPVTTFSFSFLMLCLFCNFVI